MVVIRSMILVNTALGLNAQALPGDVERQDVPHLALQCRDLQAGTQGHDLVAIDTLVRLLAASQLPDKINNRGHPGGTADQDHVIEGADADLAVVDHRVERRAATIKKIRGYPLELRAGQLLFQVQRSCLAESDVRQID